MADKKELVQEIKKMADRACARAVKLTEVEWSKTVYTGSWNVKQVYCHVAAVGSVIPRLIERAQSPQPSAQSGAFDVDAWNAKHVAMRQDKSTDEIVAEIRSSYTKAAALIESTPESVLAVKLYDPVSGGQIPLWDRLMHMAVSHNHGHLDDVARTLGK